jgi:hypothetical protein
MTEVIQGGGGGGGGRYAEKRFTAIYKLPLRVTGDRSFWGIKHTALDIQKE